MSNLGQGIVYKHGKYFLHIPITYDSKHKSIFVSGQAIKQK